MAGSSKHPSFSRSRRGQKFGATAQGGTSRRVLVVGDNLRHVEAVLDKEEDLRKTRIPCPQVRRWVVALEVITPSACQTS